MLNLSIQVENYAKDKKYKQFDSLEKTEKFINDNEEIMMRKVLKYSTEEYIFFRTHNY